MIPPDTNLDAIEQGLSEDGVHLGVLGEKYPGLVDNLVGTVSYARKTDFGNLCVVHLDNAPTRVADHRDVAEQILRDTDCSTVIVRSAVGGDIVSEDFSRKAIEKYQFQMIGSPDYSGSVRAFVDQVHGETTPWQTINVVAAIIVVFVVVITVTAASTRRVRDSENENVLSGRQEEKSLRQ